MEANEAPKKIYLDPALDALTKALSEKTEDDVEYTRTDAFIEKAALWIMENASDYCILHNSYDTKELVKDFVDAMKRD